MPGTSTVKIKVTLWRQLTIHIILTNIGINQVHAKHKLIAKWFKHYSKSLFRICGINYPCACALLILLFTLMCAPYWSFYLPLCVRPINLIIYPDVCALFILLGIPRRECLMVLSEFYFFYLIFFILPLPRFPDDNFWPPSRIVPEF